MKKLVASLIIAALCATLLPSMALAAPKKPVIGLELKVRDVNYIQQVPRKSGTLSVPKESMVIEITPTKKEDLLIVIWNSNYEKRGSKILKANEYGTGKYFGVSPSKEEAAQKHYEEIYNKYLKQNLPTFAIEIKKEVVTPGKPIHVYSSGGAVFGGIETEFYSQQDPVYYDGPGNQPYDWKVKNTNFIATPTHAAAATKYNSTSTIQIMSKSGKSDKKKIKIKETKYENKPKLITDKAFYEEFLDSVNVQRARHGLEPVEFVWEYQSETDVHVMRMAKEEEIWHWGYNLGKTKYKEDDSQIHGYGSRGQEGVASRWATTADYMGMLLAKHSGIWERESTRYISASVAREAGGSGLYGVIRGYSDFNRACQKDRNTGISTCKLQHTMWYFDNLKKDFVAEYQKLNDLGGLDGYIFSAEKIAEEWQVYLEKNPQFKQFV